MAGFVSLSILVDNSSNARDTRQAVLLSVLPLQRLFLSLFPSPFSPFFMTCYSVGTANMQVACVWGQPVAVNISTVGCFNVVSPEVFVALGAPHCDCRLPAAILSGLPREEWLLAVK